MGVQSCNCRMGRAETRGEVGSLFALLPHDASVPRHPSHQREKRAAGDSSTPPSGFSSHAALRVLAAESVLAEERPRRRPPPRMTRRLIRGPRRTRRSARSDPRRPWRFPDIAFAGVFVGVVRRATPLSFRRRRPLELLDVASAHTADAAWNASRNGGTLSLHVLVRTRAATCCCVSCPSRSTATPAAQRQGSPREREVPLHLVKCRGFEAVSSDRTSLCKSTPPRTPARCRVSPSSGTRGRGPGQLCQSACAPAAAAGWATVPKHATLATATDPRRRAPTAASSGGGASSPRRRAHRSRMRRVACQVRHQREPNWSDRQSGADRGADRRPETRPPRRRPTPRLKYHRDVRCFEAPLRCDGRRRPLKAALARTRPPGRLLMSAPERIASGTPETVTPDRAESSSAKANPPCATPNASERERRRTRGKPRRRRPPRWQQRFAGEGFRSDAPRRGTLVARDSQSRRRAAPHRRARSIARGSVCGRLRWTCRLSARRVVGRWRAIDHPEPRRLSTWHDQQGRKDGSLRGTGIRPLRASSRAVPRTPSPPCSPSGPLSLPPASPRLPRASPPQEAPRLPARRRGSPLEASFFRYRGGGGRKTGPPATRVHRGRGSRTMRRAPPLATQMVDSAAMLASSTFPADPPGPSSPPPNAIRPRTTAPRSRRLFASDFKFVRAQWSAHEGRVPEGVRVVQDRGSSPTPSEDYASSAWTRSSRSRVWYDARSVRRRARRRLARSVTNKSRASRAARAAPQLRRGGTQLTVG